MEDSQTWSELDGIQIAMFLSFARAGIEAMREPTEVMVVAGVRHENMGDMAGRWKAMIDVALDGPSE